MNARRRASPGAMIAEVRVAGDWIKMRVDLDTDPAVIGIAAALGMEETAVVGKLWKVWAWANTQTRDGNAASVTEAWLDRYTGAPGFSRAMVAVGWLLVAPGEKGGGLNIPNFERHNGRSAKIRALTSVRVGLHRRARSGATNEEARTQAPIQAARAVKAAAPPEFPLGLDTESFRAAWADWIGYRRERKLRAYGERSVRAQLSRLASWGASRACESIRLSIANGWQGLFEAAPSAGRSVRPEPDRKAEVLAQLAEDRRKRAEAGR